MYRFIIIVNIFVWINKGCRALNTVIHVKSSTPSFGWAKYWKKPNDPTVSDSSYDM